MSTTPTTSNRRLSVHFTVEEGTFSSTAIRQGITNNPNDKQITNMVIAAKGMELIRMILDSKPIYIDSWFRCEALNLAIGGAKHSAHMDGFAIDFVCPDFGTPREVAKAIAEHHVKFDQLIYEGTWVHISFDPKNRQQLLTAHFAPGKPTSYTTGIK
jgi:putative chitinase